MPASTGGVQTIPFEIQNKFVVVPSTRKPSEFVKRASFAPAASASALARTWRSLLQFLKKEMGSPAGRVNFEVMTFQGVAERREAGCKEMASVGVSAPRGE